MALLKSGDHVVCSQSRCSAPRIKPARQSEFGKFGVESSFVSLRPMSREWRGRDASPNTKLLFAETPTNPLTEVCDIQRPGRSSRTTPARC